MDDADPLTELNRLADNATAFNDLAFSEPTSDDITRWKRLFDYSDMEADTLITLQRLDVTRSRLPPSHWELVRAEREAMGYDLEAYEHELQLKGLIDTHSLSIHGLNTEWKQKSDESLFIFRMRGLLGSVEAVKAIIGEEEIKGIMAQAEHGKEVKLCAVGEKAKRKIQDWLAMRQALGPGAENRGSGESISRSEHGEGHNCTFLPSNSA